MLEAITEDHSSTGGNTNGVLQQAEMEINPSLGDLQTDEQRRVLDTVSQVRKCGLESTDLSLPQIVVCGDQSAGKSSVLEALTEIPFPRNDNLCTRFATEISLRTDPATSLTVRVIPGSARSQQEREAIKAFSASITDLNDLPALMDKAIKVMGISAADQPDSLPEPASAFAKDTLSIESKGPDRPHLTLVDIPGLIQASTKGVSEADVAMVAEITESYIEQPRTICLAVVAATHDAANQSILQRVRKVDPHGERTLGVITKPDRLSAGSGSEAKFLQLARNEDVFFKLGWHVIKNRQFEERAVSVAERNRSEQAFFATSGFKALPKANVGIDALRTKLSHLLFAHIKRELPRLQDDLEARLRTARDELRTLGEARSTTDECRAFLVQLSMECHGICKASLRGNYEHDFFRADGVNDEFVLTSDSTVARLRATIQYVNMAFAEELRTRGHKYQIQFTASEGSEESADFEAEDADLDGCPWPLSSDQAMEWVHKNLLRSRGTELVGNFNPNLVAELFWEQSEPWERLAKSHIQQVSLLCDKFLNCLLKHTAPADLQARIWSELVHDALKVRRKAAYSELDRLMKDCKDFPINYNHYYTDTVHKKRRDRNKSQLQEQVPANFPSSSYQCKSGGDHYNKDNITRELNEFIQRWADTVTPNMEQFSCEEALDCLLAIYKVQQKTFIANVVTQVIERHIVRDLHDIFSPLVIVKLSDAKVQGMVSEPPSTKQQRQFLADRVQKLEDCEEILGGVLDA